LLLKHICGILEEYLSVAQILLLQGLESVRYGGEEGNEELGGHRTVSRCSSVTCHGFQHDAGRLLPNCVGIKFVKPGASPQV